MGDSARDIGVTSSLSSPFSDHREEGPKKEEEEEIKSLLFHNTRRDTDINIDRLLIDASLHSIDIHDMPEVLARNPGLQLFPYVDVRDDLDALASSLARLDFPSDFTWTAAISPSFYARLLHAGFLPIAQRITLHMRTLLKRQEERERETSKRNHTSLNTSEELSSSSDHTRESSVPLTSPRDDSRRASGDRVKSRRKDDEEEEERQDSSSRGEGHEGEEESIEEEESDGMTEEEDDEDEDPSSIRRETKQRRRRGGRSFSYETGFLLLPKLHQERCCIDLDQTTPHISRNTRKRSKRFFFSIDRHFDGVLQGCIRQHGEGWLWKPVRQVLRILHSRRLLTSHLSSHIDSTQDPFFGTDPLINTTEKGETHVSELSLISHDKVEQEGQGKGRCRGQLSFSSSQTTRGRRRIEDDVHVHSIEVWSRDEDTPQDSLEGECVTEGTGLLKDEESRQSSYCLGVPRNEVTGGHSPSLLRNAHVLSSGGLSIGTASADRHNDSSRNAIDSGNPHSTETTPPTTTTTTPTSSPSPLCTRSSQSASLPTCPSSNRSLGKNHNSTSFAERRDHKESSSSSTSMSCQQSLSTPRPPCRCCSSSCACFSTSRGPWKLCAGEIGVRIGGVYTSLTGFSEVNEAGNIQMACLGILLKRTGVHLWDLGMEMDYKMRIGAEMTPRTSFLRAFRKARSQPPQACLNMATVVRLLDEPVDNPVTEVENRKDSKIVKNGRKQGLHAKKMKRLQKPEEEGNQAQEKEGEPITSNYTRVSGEDSPAKDTSVGPSIVSGKGCLKANSSTSCSSSTSSVYPKPVPRFVSVCERADHKHIGCKSRTGRKSDRSFPKRQFHVVNCDSLINLHRQSQDMTSRREGKGKGNR
ncbi:leucyl phenylalanyl-trna protein transferase [Cystoisospora suis]|uniref:Leucyl phenylalanyl-trna protein transferase n=1 Tax=Cystoisospora suis TaxID=483139 RepID=A0A2C6LBP9_9APIC|nr:leucyl phenylalanyl-trna protein transferase [Cystoisospora suis]